MRNTYYIDENKRKILRDSKLEYTLYYAQEMRYDSADKENADYKPHKKYGNEWWDMAYFVYLNEELGMV